MPRAAEAREILPEKLRGQGALVDVVPVYQTEAAEVPAEEADALRQALSAGEIDFVTFTSSSTVRNLMKILGGAESLKHVRTACIGPVTAATAREAGLDPSIVAETYTIDGLIEALLKSL